SVFTSHDRCRDSARDTGVTGVRDRRVTRSTCGGLVVLRAAVRGVGECRAVVCAGGRDASWERRRARSWTTCRGRPCATAPGGGESGGGHLPCSWCVVHEVTAPP